MLATLVSAFMFAGGALAAKDGDAANAKLPRGWHGLMDSATTPFSE